jgi:4-hydroxy-tetrahydrodipicolinate synthase
MFHGSMVAIVTPMHTNGDLDKKSLQNLIEWHIAEGTQAIVIAGTTGESPTLSYSEKCELIEFTVEQVNNRVPVIAGTGTNCTQTSINFTLEAERLGADASLLITPYYNKPTEEGLYEHFKLISEHAKKPLILYNNPSRTGCDLLPRTVARLSQFHNIVGIKESTGDTQRIEALRAMTYPEFGIYSGDDATNLELIARGGQGIISVVANVAPRAMRSLIDAALAKNEAEIAVFKTQLHLLSTELFAEANPIPVKWALTQMGLIQNGIRLPLMPLQKKYHHRVYDALTNANISVQSAQTIS